MPIKKTRKFGGMPWWYIRKKLVVPVFLLLALIVGVIVTFSLIKSKRLSYIPRANEEVGCQVSNGEFIPIGSEVEGFICRQGNLIITYPHLEKKEDISEAVTDTPVEKMSDLTTINTESKSPVIDIGTKQNNGTVRIMLLGDSLIGGSYIAPKLKNRLSREFQKITFEFVGSQSLGGVPHEGHGSFTTFDVVRDLQDGSWNENYQNITSAVNLNVLKPDVVVIQLGTNNIASGRGYSFASYQDIVTELRKSNQNVKIIVSKVPMMFDKISGEKPRFVQEVEAYNSSLDKDIARISTGNSPVVLTAYPNFTSVDVSNADGVHPVEGGESILISNYTSALHGFYGNNQL